MSSTPKGIHGIIPFCTFLVVFYRTPHTLSFWGPQLGIATLGRENREHDGCEQDKQLNKKKKKCWTAAITVHFWLRNLRQLISLFFFCFSLLKTPLTVLASAHLTRGALRLKGNVWKSTLPSSECLIQIRSKFVVCFLLLYTFKRPF